MRLKGCMRVIFNTLKPYYNRFNYKSRTDETELKEVDNDNKIVHSRADESKLHCTILLSAKGQPCFRQVLYRCFSKRFRFRFPTCYTPPVKSL